MTIRMIPINILGSLQSGITHPPLISDINNIATNQIKGFWSRDPLPTNGGGRLCGDEKLVDHQSSLDDETIKTFYWLQHTIGTGSPLWGETCWAWLTRSISSLTRSRSRNRFGICSVLVRTLSVTSIKVPTFRVLISNHLLHKKGRPVPLPLCLVRVVPVSPDISLSQVRLTSKKCHTHGQHPAVGNGVSNGGIFTTEIRQLDICW